MPVAPVSSALRGLLPPSLLLLAACRAPAPPAVPASPAAAVAAAPGGHGAHAMHAGHDMSAMGPVTIPAGALYTEADVRFMQGMIAHHGQAIAMSRLAVTRGGEPRVLRFAQKIDQSQAAEIQLMQEWLRAHDQVAPEAESWRTMSMPGMLTPDEMAQLEAARGVEFDRLFLRLMIRHHEGAIRMVADLIATPRAAQDVDVSVFATDVETTQTAEIALMRRMLLDL
jgi:uncharacterized protein (DUF305 family)